jgi:hypothetical protein
MGDYHQIKSCLILKALTMTKQGGFLGAKSGAPGGNSITPEQPWGGTNPVGVRGFRLGRDQPMMAGTDFFFLSPPTLKLRWASLSPSARVVGKKGERNGISASPVSGHAGLPIIEVFLDRLFHEYFSFFQVALMRPEVKVFIKILGHWLIEHFTRAPELADTEKF